MNIQWYPGHMTKARRMMQENIKLIDIVIELVDARCPLSSKNPDIDTLAGGKARLILLNKCDMADPKATAAWEAYFKDQGFFTLQINSRSGSGVKNVSSAVNEACKEKIERDRKRGIKNRPVRAMIVGIPNVGKSTFINSYAGKACTKTGNKPGVTKGKQWIRLNKNIELLDTPGILWPKFEDQTVGMRLAQTGSINDDILNMTEVAVHLIGYLKSVYPETIANRYAIDETASADEILSAVAKVRGCLMKGGIPDPDKAAQVIIDDYRNMKLGRLTLETP